MAKKKSDPMTAALLDRMPPGEDDAAPEPQEEAAPAGQEGPAEAQAEVKHFRVQVRHSPALRKMAVVRAASEQEAWDKFCRFNTETMLKKNLNARAAEWGQYLSRREYVEGLEHAPKYHDVTEVTEFDNKDLIPV